MRRASSCARLPRVGEEKLLAVDLVIINGLLTLRRGYPLDKRLSQFLLDGGVLGGIDQDDAVLVEKSLVALEQDREIAAVLEGEPGSAICQYVRADPCRSV